MRLLFRSSSEFVSALLLGCISMAIDFGLGGCVIIAVLVEFVFSGRTLADVLL